jgi:hypothetical protein
MSQPGRGVDVEGIGTSFGSVAALRDISFVVDVVIASTIVRHG